MLSELQDNAGTRKRHPKRARAILLTAVIILIPLVVWSHPPAAAVTPSPEHLDARRYLSEAKASAFVGWNPESCSN